MILSANYSEAVFSHERIRRVVDDLSLAIPALMQLHEADTIVVSGKSGISAGFAALTRINFPLAVVRKPGENSHGSLIEGTDQHDMRRYIILDDFVSSGSTVDRIVEDIDKRAGSDVHLVAIIEYDRDRYPDDHDTRFTRKVRRYGAQGWAKWAAGPGAGWDFTPKSPEQRADDKVKFAKWLHNKKVRPPYKPSVWTPPELPKVELPNLTRNLLTDVVARGKPIDWSVIAPKVYRPQEAFSYPQATTLPADP